MADHRGFHVRLVVGSCSETYTVDCLPQDTPAGVKRRAQQVRAVAAAVQSLHRRPLGYDGQVLDDDTPLAHYNLPVGCELLVLDEAGGGGGGGPAAGLPDLSCGMRDCSWRRAARTLARPVDRVCLPLKWGYLALFVFSILFGPHLLLSVAGAGGGVDGVCRVLIPADCTGVNAATPQPAVVRFAHGTAVAGGVWGGPLEECVLPPDMGRTAAAATTGTGVVADRPAARDVCAAPRGALVQCVLRRVTRSCSLPEPLRSTFHLAMNAIVRAGLFCALLFVFGLAWKRVLDNLRTSLMESYSVENHPHVRQMDQHGYTQL